MSDRYQGKPFLKLAESFVMKALGALDPASEATLAAMTPKLQAIYRVSGTWDEIVKAVLELPDGIEKEIHELWVMNKNRAQSMGLAFSEADFTIAYVDKLFSTRA